MTKSLLSAQAELSYQEGLKDGEKETLKKVGGWLNKQLLTGQGKTHKEKRAGFGLIKKTTFEVTDGELDQLNKGEMPEYKISYLR